MIVSVCASHVIQIHDECWHLKILIIAIIKLVTSILVTNPLVYINNMMTLEGTIKCREMYKSEMGKVKILSQMVISLVFYLQRKIVIPSESITSISFPQKTDVQVQRYLEKLTLRKRISKHVSDKKRSSISVLPIILKTWSNIAVQYFIETSWSSLPKRPKSFKIKEKFKKQSFIFV